jgi:hypothetical protein
MASGIDSRAAHLLIVAAVAAVIFPELGDRWILAAADLTKSFGRRNRGAHFRICLGEQLEFAGVGCSAGDGRHVLGRLQWLLSAAPHWYGERFPRPLPAKRGMPPPPPCGPPDPEAIKIFREKFERRAAAKQRQEGEQPAEEPAARILPQPRWQKGTVR